MASASGSPPRTVTAVARLLQALGARGAPWRVDPVPPDTIAAAEALSCPVGAIALTSVFAVRGAPFLVVVSSAAHRPDPITLSGLLGMPEIRPATSEETAAATGQDPAAPAPIAHPRPLDTMVDVELSHHDTVWASAGAPGWFFETTYAELLRVTAGEAAEVGDLSPQQ